MAATIRSLTQSQLAEEVAARLANAGWPTEFSDGDENTYDMTAVVKEVFAHLHETVLDEIQEGIPVNVVNVARITTRYTPAKPRRWVRSPMTGEEVLADARPARIVAKARPTTAAQNSVPTTRSAKGKEIAKTATARSRKRERAARARERDAA